jgi:hypothetical protein
MSRKGVELHLTTPHRPSPIDATPEVIGEVLREIENQENPYVILSGNDEMTFMQALWTPRGFVLEVQKGSLDQHYRCVQEDLSLEAVRKALCFYLTTDGSFPPSLKFRRVDVRPLWYRLGYTIGHAVGRLARMVRRAATSSFWR